MSANSNSTIPSSSPQISSTPPPTSLPPPPSSTPPPPPPTSSTPTPTEQSTSNEPSNIPTSVVTTSAKSPSQVTEVITITSVAQGTSTPIDPTSLPNQPTTSSPAASLQPGGSGGAGRGGLSAGGKTAVAVAVPVAVVALLVLGGIFLWRRRKQRKNAEEARRKEVEDYGYNPNNDPTLPPIGGLAGAEMTEDASGYRGWGTMTTNPSNRKTSTTVSGGQNAGYSDNGSQQGGYRSPGSPTQVSNSDGHSGDPLVARRRTLDSDGIGALGAAPAAGANRTDIRRGPSNASSQYSTGARSEESDGPVPVGSPHDYYQDNAYYQPGPYGDSAAYGGGQQPVIRDVQARRNTRIENPSVFPHQGNSGIAQNF